MTAASEPPPEGFAAYTPRFEAPRISREEAPAIDGDLSDPVWAKAAVIDRFYQVTPAEGGTPSQPTRAYVMYDDRNLYVGVYNYDAEPEKIVRTVPVYTFKTDLTVARIQDSFSSPSTVSFWELPRFIAALEATGFSALGHRLHWHSLVAEPMLYVAMILIAAVFSLRHNRRRGVLFAVAGGIATGFVLFFLSDLVLALAHSTRLPPLIAAWAPPLASALIGLAALMHAEDG